MQQELKEKQILQNPQNQIQREIQYYIYQDLENALCQLGQLEETLEIFKNSKDQSYIPIAMNKVILQANLSFGIHLDQYSLHNRNEEGYLIQCKTKAKSIFEEALNQKIIKNTHPKVQEICKFYLNQILSDKKMVQQQMLPLEEVQIQSQFNHQALEKVIWGTQIVDKQLRQVQKNEYQPPTIQDIFLKIKKSKEDCGRQLKKNFDINDLPQQNNQSSSNNKGQINNSKIMTVNPQQGKKLQKEQRLIKNNSEIKLENKNQKHTQITNISNKTQKIDKNTNAKVDQFRNKTQGLKIQQQTNKQKK